MFEILDECTDYVFCQDMITEKYCIFYKNGGRSDTTSLYATYDYGTALMKWKDFQFGKYD